MNRATPARNSLADFSLRAHRSSRPRDTRACVVFARASTHISKANVGGAGKMSHCSRKNQMRCVERTFLCPSSSSCFDRSSLQNRKWSREFSVSSENETSRTMQLEYKTTRRAMYGSSCPSNLCRRLVGGVCFFFFSLVFFSSRFRQKQPQFALFFVCVDARQPSKRGKSLSYSSVSPPFKLKEEKEIQILFFCLLVLFWNSMIP